MLSCPPGDVELGQQPQQTNASSRNTLWGMGGGQRPLKMNTGIFDALPLRQRLALDSTPRVRQALRCGETTAGTKQPPTVLVCIVCTLDSTHARTLARWFRKCILHCAAGIRCCSAPGCSQCAGKGRGSLRESGLRGWVKGKEEQGREEEGEEDWGAKRSRTPTSTSGAVRPWLAEQAEVGEWDIKVFIRKWFLKEN